MENLKWSFIIGFVIVQVLDTISTIKALKRPDTYEVNPFLNWFMGLGMNYAVAIIIYMLVMTILVVGSVLLIDYYRQDVGNRALDFGMGCFYVIGILYLVIYRFIFIVIPNFVL